MNKPPILEPAWFGTFKLVCKDIFLATFGLGGSSVLVPGAPLIAGWFETPPGLVGLR